MADRKIDQLGKDIKGKVDKLMAEIKKLRRGKKGKRKSGGE